MMMPSIWNDNLFDNFFSNWKKNFSLGSLWEDKTFPSIPSFENGLMKADVREKDGYYLVDLELPGISKEDVKAKLKDGYLTITAEKNQANEEKDKSDNYIRRERYFGQCSRSFYVGENITQEEINAKFDNGILTLIIPKKDVKAIEADQYIKIE